MVDRVGGGEEEEFTSDTNFGDTFGEQGTRRPALYPDATCKIAIIPPTITTIINTNTILKMIKKIMKKKMVRKRTLKFSKKQKRFNSYK